MAAISNIFIGMLLVFLNFNINIGASQIGLIPDFVGYIIMRKGLTELFSWSDKFPRVVPYVTGMAVYSGICYALAIFGVSISLILGLFSTVVSLYISYSIIMGIKDIELSKAQDLHSERLYSTWKLLALFSLVTYALLFIPGLSIIVMIAAFIIGVYYLIVFNETKNLFYQHNSTD